MTSPNLSEIVTTTIEARSRKLADNISKNHALLDRLEQKGKRKPVSGGRQIIQELEYGENSTFGWYSGYDPLNIAPSDVITAAQFDWKQCAVAVSINGLEELMNDGEEAFINLLESRIENAEKYHAQQACRPLFTRTVPGSWWQGIRRPAASRFRHTRAAGTVGGINARDVGVLA
jgi:hypothetical protein